MDKGDKMSCKCFYCGAFVRWDGDYDEEDWVFSEYHCEKCGVNYTTSTKTGDDEYDTSK